MSIEYNLTMFARKANGHFFTSSYEDFEQICKKNKHVFEVVSDSQNIFLYFDVDFYDEFTSFNEEDNKNLCLLANTVLKDYFLETFNININTSIASSSAKYYSTNNNQIKWKYSFHLIITNMKMLKKNLLTLVKSINNYASNKYPNNKFIKNNKLFDDKPYNPGVQRLRCIYTSKDGENRPLYIISGSFKDFVVTDLNNNNEIVFNHLVENVASIPSNSNNSSSSSKNASKSSKNATKSSKNIPKTLPPATIQKSRDTLRTQDDTLNLIYDCVRELLNINNNMFKEYDEWRDLGFVFYNACEPDNEEAGLKLFQELSKNHIKNFKSLEDVKTQYYKASNDIENPKTYAWLLWLLKEKSKDNNILFKINQKYPQTAFFFVDNDREAADIVFNNLKHLFKTCQHRTFMLHNHVWIFNEQLIEDIMINYITQSKIYKGFDKKTQKLMCYAQNITKTKQIKDLVMTIIRLNTVDEQLYKLFHTTTKDKLCFNDGVLNMKEQTFTLWENVTDVYTTLKINRDFQTTFLEKDSPNSLELIQKIHNDIFIPLYYNEHSPNMLEDAYHFLVRAICGHNEDKTWATYLGNRNCGKGVEYELFKTAFEDYVSSFELSNILRQKNASISCEETSKKLYWLMDLEFVRLAVSQETDTQESNLFLSSKILKKITGGGDEIVARRNFDKRDTHFKLATTFYIKGNNVLEPDTPDCNETQLKLSSVIQFKSQLELDSIKEQYNTAENDYEDHDEKQTLEYEMSKYRLANPNIKTMCQTVEWGNALILLLLQKYKNSKITLSNEWNESLTNNGTNCLMGNIVTHYEITKNSGDIVLCKDVFEKLEGYDKRKVLNELLYLGVKKMQCNQKSIGRQYVFIGMKNK
jgi:hypothetical protein